MTNWKARLKYRFGINEKDYNLILKKQKGRCAICKKLPLNQRLDIDHNHTTGIIRGLLCRGCNRFLGLLENGRYDTKVINAYFKKNPLGRKVKAEPRKS